MKNKYAFRMYRFDKNGDIYSPFADYNSAVSRLGDTQVVDSPVDGYDSDDSGGLWYNGMVHNTTPKHFGYSILGKADPKYSIFNFFIDYLQPEEINGFLSNDYTRAITDEVNKYAKNVPESLKNKDDFINDYVNNYFGRVDRDTIKNDYDLLTHKRSPLLANEKADFLEKLRDGDAGRVTSFALPQKHSAFNSERVWDYFVKTVSNFLKGYVPNESNNNGTHTDNLDNFKLVLASVPEDKLLSVDDVIKNGYTAQRDFPEELITSEITPLRVFDGFYDAAANYRNLRTFDKVPAAEAFGESFKLEPGDFVSDKQLKNIYHDMCYAADYNRDKKQQCANIVNAIRELGQ